MKLIPLTSTYKIELSLDNFTAIYDAYTDTEMWDVVLTRKLKELKGITEVDIRSEPGLTIYITVKERHDSERLWVRVCNIMKAAGCKK